MIRFRSTLVLVLAVSAATWSCSSGPARSPAPAPAAPFSVVEASIPDMQAACREIVRVAKPGAEVRLMFYNRRSYHYALVKYVIAPAIRVLLALPFGHRNLPTVPRATRDRQEVAMVTSGFLRFQPAADGKHGTPTGASQGDHS